MLNRIAMVPVLLLSISATRADAICMVEPIEQKVAAADTVFIATILSASLADPSHKLVHRAWYDVTYTFEVRKVIKGDPTRVTSLYTQQLYSDPIVSDKWTMAEATILQPGDSVAVFAKGTGRVFPGACGLDAGDLAKYARENANSKTEPGG